MVEAHHKSPDGRREAMIFDVDGTLCDVRPVLHYVQGPPGAETFRRRFDQFHAESAYCPPYMNVVNLAHTAFELGFAILVVTGREEQWRSLTVDWLARHQVPWTELHTRPAKDYRPDHIVKTEIESEIRMRFQVLLAVDDRQDIISVWHAAGIATARVDDEGTVQSAIAPPDGTLDRRITELLTK